MPVLILNRLGDYWAHRIGRHVVQLLRWAIGGINDGCSIRIRAVKVSSSSPGFCRSSPMRRIRHNRCRVPEWIHQQVS
jgi:hypothetical protein